MIWFAFAILATLVAILYAWVWQINDCHNKLSRRVWKDDVPPRPVESAPIFVSEKWSFDLNPKGKRPCRGRKRPVRKTKKERGKWDR